MTPMFITGQVVNGHFQHEEPLTGLEGQRVIAALTVVPTEPSNGKTRPLPESDSSAAPPTTDEDFDPEPPEWLQVENDVYFPMDVPEILLEKRDLIVEDGTPSFILPEVLPSE